MKFVRVSRIEDCVVPLRDRLMQHLSGGQHVLWLVTGGSNIPLTVAVMSQLSDDETAHLTVMLADERYGEVGHPNSNAHQLDVAGFVPKQATVIPVLQDGVSLQDSCRHYDAAFQAAAHQADVIIGQFGMGADGHIAGILPQSAAVTSADMASAYETANYTRLTLTPKALTQLTIAYACVFGDDKRHALEQLQSEHLSISDQPAQLLRHTPEAYIYNDQIGHAAENNGGNTT